MALWVFGSLNTDLVTTTPRFAEPGETLTATSFAEFSGGKGANQAVALARLGASPRLVGLLGDDDYGRSYRRVLGSEGVDARFVGEAPGARSGLAVIEVVAGGENRILVVPGANALVEPAWLAAALAEVAAGDFVLLQLEWPLAAVAHALRELKRRGAVTILDPAPAVALDTRLLADVDYLTPNAHEALLLAGPAAHGDPLSAAKALATRGPTVVLKAGAEGSFVVTAAGAHRVAPYAVIPVDTTAAGDAFNAAFAHALSRGLSAHEAAEWGNAAGALSTTAAGAQAAMPTWTHLARWKSHAERG